MNSTYSNLVKIYQLMVVQSHAREQERTKRSKTRVVKIGTSLCCLVCRGQDNLVKLRYEPDPSNTAQDVFVENYIEMIFTCFNIDIRDEEGGGCICEVCIERLRDALDFKTRLEEAENILQLHINDDTNADTMDAEDPIPDEEKKSKQRNQRYVVNDQELEILPPRLKFGTTQCPVCKEVHFNFTTLKTHYTAHFQPSFECTQCGKLFLTKKKLSDHLRIHTHKSHICQTCGKNFMARSQLERHIRSNHEANKESPCDFCTETFPTYRERLKHQRKMHSNSMKKLACHICNKDFQNPSDQQRHIKTVHMGVRLYPCTLCDHRAPCTSGLKKHMETHKLPTFACTMCVRKFKSEETYNRHLLVHTNKKINCPHCESTYSTRQSLQYHMTRAHKEHLVAQI